MQILDTGPPPASELAPEHESAASSGSQDGSTLLGNGEVWWWWVTMGGQRLSPAYASAAAWTRAGTISGKDKESSVLNSCCCSTPTPPGRRSNMGLGAGVRVAGFGLLGVHARLL